MHCMRPNVFLRCLCFCFMLCYCSLAQSQSLKKIEYFFDTDPGVGNGISISLTNAAVIDSTFKFDVSSIANGLHTIYVRLQDNNLNWSLNYSASFMKTSGTDGVTAIKRLEYFFDTDPGVANGTFININQNAGTIDSTFAFDVSSLSNGLHMVYVRAIDADNNYSLNYATSFVKAPGNDTALSITKLEYFLDNNDPGFGNGTNVSIKPSPVINDTFVLQIPDNGADSRRLYIRAQDNRGQWSLLYNDTLSLCNLYKPSANFSWVRFADLYSFIDSSKNNPSHKLLWNFDNLGTDSVSNPQFTFPQGNHFVKLVAGMGCRKDSTVLPLFTGLEKYYPDTALVGGDIFMNFYGGGLDTNVVVTLSNSAANITPYAKAAYQQQFFAGAFDLHTASPGVYNVKLHFSNGYDTTIVNGLRLGTVPIGDGVTQYSPELKLSIEGPEVARSGTIVTQRLIITNVGGMVAKSIPVWIQTQTPEEFAPAPFYRTYFAPDNKMDYRDSVPTDIGVDSTVGQSYGGKLSNFIIPALNAGESYVYTYTLRAPLVHGAENYVDFWVGKRMFGSPFQWDCIHAALDIGFNLAGLIPVVGCAAGVTGFAVDFVSGMMGQFGFNSDRSYDRPGNVMYGLASAAWGCIPGAKTAEEAAKIARYTVTAINSSKKALDVRKAAYDHSNIDQNPCDDENDPVVRYRKGIRGRVAADPNGISGPGGLGGDNNYITGLGKQGYEVFFENLPTATANAQRIYVTDTLDKAKFDLSSFELTGFTIADSFYRIPYQRKEFTTTLDLRPAMNLLLRVNAKLDTASGILNYSFLSLDPTTRDTLPLSDLRGFLPPDVNDHDGKGSVSYVVSYKKNITTNDIITNKASMVFDNNAAILTNTWLNTIDQSAPTGGVINGTRINDTTALLKLSGSDVGVNIERYKLYGRRHNDPFILLGIVYGDTVRVSGAKDSTYSFYAIPYDSVGNFLAKAPSAEYSITFSNALPLQLVSFTAQKQQNDVLTTWQTFNQINFDHYELERSLNGSEFSKVGTVQANNVNSISNYQYNDVNAVNLYRNNGKLFYRLKMIDKDRTATYSKIARVDFDKKYTVSVYPNPADDRLNLDGVQNYRNIRIMDVSGKTVIEKNSLKTFETINISKLQKGIYIIKLTGDDDVQSIKFLKK
jgi:hypothetical protein